MKIVCAVFAAATLLAPMARAATPTSGAPDSKFVVIDTEVFSDPKDGIKKLISVLQQAEREFKAQRDALQEQAKKFDQLVTEAQSATDPRVAKTKSDQAEALKREIERKQEDGQRALERRLKELTDPIYKDLFVALKAFGNLHGIQVILDKSKLGAAMLVVNDQADITRAFISDYNAKHPIK